MKSGGIGKPPISLKDEEMDVWGKVASVVGDRLIESDGPRECIFIYVIPDIESDVLREGEKSGAVFDGVIAREEKRKDRVDAWRCTPTSDLFRISEVWVVGMPLRSYVKSG